MAKARTILTINITVRLPVGVNANDMMNFVRARLAGLPGVVPTNMAPVDSDKLQDAIKSDETKVSLVRKLTEYK